MRKIIVTAAILWSINSGAQSKDSSLIANSDLRKAAILIEQGKGCKSEIEVYKRQVNILDQRLDVKDSALKEWGLKGNAFEALDRNRIMQLNNFGDQLAIAKSNIKILEKNVKQQKARTWVISILASAAIGYLLLK